MDKQVLESEYPKTYILSSGLLGPPRIKQATIGVARSTTEQTQ